MASLLAKNEGKPSSTNDKDLSVTRGQELTGEVIQISSAEVVLDLGKKAEGVLPKKDLSPEQVEELKVGDKLHVFVVSPGNESGQVILALKQQSTSKSQSSSLKWDKFQDAISSGKTFSAKGIDVNKGGLIV